MSDSTTDSVLAKKVFRSTPVLRTAISLSVILIGSALFGWYMLPPVVRVQFTWFQVATLAFFVLFMVGMMITLGLSQIVVSDRGLTVRNCLSTRSYRWDEVETATFGGGDPWPYLVLQPSATNPDGDSRMMLGIQRVEGDAAAERVKELRALIAQHRAG